MSRRLTAVEPREAELRSLYGRTTDVLEVVKLRGLHLGESGNKVLITCPWQHEHTTGDGPRDTALFLEDNRVTGFKCFHGHCDERSLADVRKFFGLTVADPQTDSYEKRLQAAILQERARREARRTVDAEERGPVEPPEVATLCDLLAQPDTGTAWRVDGWQPCDSRVIFAAQFKAGKTTVVENLARSLLDGDKFLGSYTVAPVDGTVAILDFEMSPRQLMNWYRDQGIKNTDRLWLITLRGRAASFDIIDTGVRATWVKVLASRQVRYLVLDCLRPVIDALGLDENRDTGKFLVALDALLQEAGISECLVVHHMGHANERSRGDSRLRDWPDVEWRLMRQDDDPASDRFITAYGRDVEIAEQQLAYDAVTRRLVVAGGSRREAEASEALVAVMGFIGASTQPPSQRDILKGLADSGHANKVVRAAIKLGLQSGQIVTDRGKRGAQLHRLTEAAGVQTAMFGEQRGRDTRIEL